MKEDFHEGTGVLLVGHGTRNQRGQEEFRQVAPLLRELLPGVPIEDCVLELASPDIPAGVDALAAQGVRKMVAAPLLLFSAGHAKKDIPDAIEQAVSNHSGVSWHMSKPLGDHLSVLELSKHRFDAAASAVPHGEEVTLVIVSRGSSDKEAIASVHHFAALHSQRLPVAAMRVGFLAAAKPKIDEVLEWAAVQPAGHVVVQPHLLFYGQLIQEVSQRVEAMKADPRNNKKWYVANHLGPSAEIVTAILARLAQSH